MLEKIAIILLLFWVFGVISSNTFGGFIHILLVIALISILVHMIQNKRF